MFVYQRVNLDLLKSPGTKQKTSSFKICNDGLLIVDNKPWPWTKTGKQKNTNKSWWSAGRPPPAGSRWKSLSTWTHDRQPGSFMSIGRIKWGQKDPKGSKRCKLLNVSHIFCCTLFSEMKARENKYTSYLGIWKPMNVIWIYEGSSALSQDAVQYDITQVPAIWWQQLLFHKAVEY